VTLRSSYLTTKQLAKGFLNQKQKANLPSGVVHQYLPPCPRSLEASRWTAAYGEDKPAAKFPDGVTMELLRQLMATVPERGNSALLRVQHQVQGAPAAAFVNPFFMQMAMQMNQMQVGMGATFFQRKFAAERSIASIASLASPATSRHTSIGFASSTCTHP
jgi:hypothetical protein